MPAPLRFRAWHTEQKKMYTPEEMCADELTLAVDGRGLVNVSGVSPKLSQYVGDRMIVMQSTGLTDKNGQEIFEGDIVKELPNGHVAAIKWGDLQFYMDPPYEPRDLSELACRDRLKVIGNSYENPDLLPARSGN